MPDEMEKNAFSYDNKCGRCIFIHFTEVGIIRESLLGNIVPAIKFVRTAPFTGQ